MSHDLINLLQQIEADDSDVRINAADALGEIGELAVDPLCHSLGHSKWFVRASAAYALGGIGGSKAIKALCDTIGNHDINDPVGSCNVRLSVACALERIGEPAVEPLCTVFENGDKDARWTASIALGKIGDIRAVRLLCIALADSDGDIRACAVSALGKIGSPAVDQLCKALLHPELIRQAVPDKWLVRRTAHDLIVTDLPDEWIIRACAANALAEIGDIRAEEPLRKVLRHIDNPIRKFTSWAFAERLDFMDGTRLTASASAANALRRALEKIGKDTPTSR